MYMDPENTLLDPNELPKPAVEEVMGTHNLTVAITRLWYEAALRELETAGVLKRPSVEAIQTIAVLTLSNSNFGEHQQEFMLMGLAVNMARLLNFHRLGTEGLHATQLNSIPVFATAAQREQCRRLWWTLVICDW